MSDSPQLTGVGKLVLFLFVAACLFGAYKMLLKPAAVPTGAPAASPASPGLLDRMTGGGGTPSAEIGIAYGTEKKRWLEWAAGEFAKTDAGARIKVNLIPMGSLEGAQAILKGDSRIHVWSPASALYKDVFVQEWTIQH